MFVMIKKSKLIQECNLLSRRRKVIGSKNELLCKYGLQRRKKMIKEKQLNDDLMTIKIGKAQSLAELKEALEKISSENQIPMIINTDTLKKGGLFNSKELECLVIKHPDHVHDYYHIVVTLGGIKASIVSTGTSKQMKKFATAEALKDNRRGKSLSYKIGNAAVGSLFLIGKSKNKLEIEKNYYDAVIEVIGFCLEAES